MKNALGKKHITPKARLSFPHLFTPDTGEMGGGKFSAVFWVDRTNPTNVPWLKELKADCQRVAKEAFGTTEVKLPLKDGDAKGEESKGCIILSAKSKYRPQVVGGNMEPLIESDAYAGCYVRASITPYAYDTKGNKGVSFYLGNVQKLEDGEPLSGGGSSAEEDFAADGAPVTEETKEAEDFF